MSADDRSILLVEGVEADRRAIAKGLLRQGFPTETAESADEAFPILESRAFHGLVVNIRVSRTRDRDLIDWVRGQGVVGPIVAVGQNETPIVERIALKKGADAFLRKPVDVKALAEVLSKGLGEPAPKEEESFSGTVRDVDLLSYVQFMLLSGQDTVIEIRSKRGESGLIFINRGDVCHATLGDLSGEEALYRCLMFRSGSFRNLPWRPPERKTINKPGDFLLFEAARLRDEPAEAPNDPTEDSG